MDIQANHLTDEEVITQIIAVVPHTAHLKDGKTNKYISVNPATLNFYGLENSNQLIGRTIQDVDVFMHKNWGTAFVNDVSKLEYDVRNKKERLLGRKHIIMLRGGKLIIQQMEKTPIIGKSGKASSILTVGRQDLTNELSLEQLYQLYKNYYVNKRTSIYMFLKHIGLDKCFSELPTESELKVLITKKSYSRSKEVAYVLSLAPKSVELYTARLSEKLLDGNLSNTILMLRNLREY